MFKTVMISIAVLVLAGCDDKVKYVDVHGECKYVEINGQPMMCSEMTNANEFEQIYVAPCMTPATENGVKGSIEMCR